MLTGAKLCLNLAPSRLLLGLKLRRIHVETPALNGGKRCEVVVGFSPGVISIVFSL